MPERLQYVDSAGAVLELSDLPGVRALGDSGLDMPPVSFIEDAAPGQAGARLRDARIGARDAVLPFYLEAASETALRDLLRSLAKRMNPQRGDGRLRYIAVNGTTRDLTCRYNGGLEGARVVGQAGPTYRKGALVFRAVDPFWYDTTPTTVTLTAGSGGTFLGSPFLPIKLGSDVVLGQQSVVNDGDVEAWPVWTVAGPVSSVMFQNLTTGLTIDLPVPLLAGESLVIDTRPFRKTVRQNNGANLYGSLTATSALWPLREGINNVNIMANGSTVDTYVTLVYSRRYLSP